MDISLGQEERAKQRAREEAEKYSEAVRPPSTLPKGRSAETDIRTTATGSIPDTGGSEFDSELGTTVAGFDPYDQAYLQPALRANPRAKPEQPFPPAQLGREDVLFGRASAKKNNTGPVGFDDSMIDSGATVRLKSMSQQDRKLTNRWWDDQMQRCGEQNVFAILMGDCGTLTLGRRATLAEPVTEHQIV